MNSIYQSTLKAMACGAAALALTAVFTWSFVESTSVVRSVASPAALAADTVVIMASRLTHSGVTAALVD